MKVLGNDPATLLVIGEHPTKQSDKMGRGFEGTAERWFRSMLGRHWKGRVVYDYALKCFPRGATLNASYHNHCRPYLSAVLRDAKPERIITLGNHAAKGLLGYARGGASHCNRKGYGYLPSEHGLEIPVFLLSKPTDPSQNRFLRRRFEHDLTWALTARPPAPPVRAVAYALDPTADDAEFLFDYLHGARWFSLDVETYGEHFADDFRILSMGISADHTDDVVALYEDALQRGTPTFDALRHVLTSDRWIKRGQNFKYDFQSVRLALGIEMAPVFGDTRLMYKQLNPDGDAALDQLGELVGMGGHKEEADEIVKAEVKRLRSEFRRHNPGAGTRHFRAYAYAYAALPRDVNLRYVSRDALTTTKLFRKYEPELRRAFKGDLWATYLRTVDPASQTLSNIESNGVAVSAEHIRALGTHLEMQLLDIEDELAKHGDIKPASHASVSDFLYNQLGLPVLAFTKSGKPSTSKATLEAARWVHEAIPLILEWRRLAKLSTTYVAGLLPFIRDDGRIHPTLLLDGTGTGRLSCKDPNLQNQPSRGGEEAKLVKACFIAGPGRLLLQVDYGTLEIRVAALLSGDPRMIEVLQSGVDFHLATAKLIGPTVWGMSPDEIEAEFRAGDKTKRSIAKTINFGTLYGQSSFALAIQISNIIGREFSDKQAAKAQDAILGEYVVLREWIRDQRMRVEIEADAWTVWDGVRARRRPLYSVGFKDAKRSGTASRSSFNTPIQGTGSDYCLMSLIELERLCREFWGRRCFPVLTVHDSILFDMELDLELVREVIRIIHEVMTGWPSGDVPLVVDFEAGPSWGAMEGLKVDDDGELRDFSVLDRLIEEAEDA